MSTNRLNKKREQYISIDSYLPESFTYRLTYKPSLYLPEELFINPIKVYPLPQV